MVDGKEKYTFDLGVKELIFFRCFFSSSYIFFDYFLLTAFL